MSFLNETTSFFALILVVVCIFTAAFSAIFYILQRCRDRETLPVPMPARAAVAIPADFPLKNRVLQLFDELVFKEMEQLDEKKEILTDKEYKDQADALMCTYKLDNQTKLTYIFSV